MSATPELPNDQSCPQLTHTTPSHLLEKHTGLLNTFYPTISIQFGQTQQTFALFIFICNLLTFWHAAAYKVRLIVKEFPAAVPSQSNIFKTFSKISSELVSSQYQYIISCLFRTCRDSEEHCVLGLRLMQANSNGSSFTHLKLSMKQWQIRMHDIHRTNKFSAQ